LYEESFVTLHESGMATDKNAGKIPVTLLTGFLGSGKTTLLNHILSADHGYKIAVIENEYGEIGIDDALVKKKFSSDEMIFEMNNGCVCCTLRGDLIQVFKRLAKLQKKGKKKVDYIVIESTGMADPCPVAQTFTQSEEVKEYAYLDGVITVVDSKHIEEHLNSTNVKHESAGQIAFADRLLMNKTDLCSKDDLLRVKDRVRDINPMADMVDCCLKKAGIDLKHVLATNLYNIENSLKIDPDFLKKDAHHDDDSSDDSHSHGSHSHGSKDSHSHGHGKDDKDEHSHGHGDDHSDDSHSHGHGDKDGDDHKEEEHGHGAKKKKKKKKHGHGHHSHGHAHKHHDDGITTVGFKFVGEMDQKKLNSFLGQFLQTKGNDIYRMKGILALQGMEEKFIFQGVHMLFDATPSEKWGEDEEKLNKFIFIGKDINKEELQKQFLACKAE